MNDILKEASEARKFSVALKQLEYSGDLVEKMKTHSDKLESIYGKIHKLHKADVRDPKRYNKFYDIADHMHSWFQKAEALQQEIRYPESLPLKPFLKKPFLVHSSPFF